MNEHEQKKTTNEQNEREKLLIFFSFSEQK